MGEKSINKFRNFPGFLLISLTGNSNIFGGIIQEQLWNLRGFWGVCEEMSGEKNREKKGECR